MEEKMKNNPWKGLQSYQETDIIFGRDEEIKALYTRILYNTQTVVYGKSGIGKSSIINAGIIPRAKYDDMLPISIRLAHTTKKKQVVKVPYIQQIMNRLREEVLKAGGELEEIVPHVFNHEETLWELLHRYRIWKGKGSKRKRLIPLLLFDQFEEIFTLEISNKRVESFFSELADLLNEVRPTYLAVREEINSTDLMSQINEDKKERLRNVFSKITNKKRNACSEYLDKSEFHLVITIREDFLSYLERYTTYIPSMKQNRFPLLPLNEEQAAKIIMEPIRDLVHKDVAKLIIDKVTGRTDFKLDGIPEIEVNAAILSLYMKQLYERKCDEDNAITSELVQDSDDIIKSFYEDSIEGISEKTIELLEYDLITNADKRDNVARIDLISKGVPEEVLDKLIDKRVLRQFSYAGDLRIELIHDILCPIVNDRIEHRSLLAKEKEAKRIEEENRHIKMQNDRLNKIRSLFLSEKANGCQKDRYMAQMLALEALPKDLEKPDKPLVPQAEAALRKTIRISYCPMIGHKNTVIRVMSTPDGTQVLSLSRDGKVCLWDAYSGAQLKEFDCGKDTISTISICENGSKKVVTYSNGVVQLNTFDSFEVVDEFSLAGASPKVLAISPNGAIMAIGLENGNVILYTFGQKLLSTQSSIKTIDVLIFSPNGDELIAIGEGCMKSYSVKIGEWNKLDNGILSAITCVSYSKNGKYLFCGTENGKIVIWESCASKRKKKEIVECENSDCKIGAISISSNTKKIAYSVGGKLVVLECDSQFGRSPQEAKEHGMKYHFVKKHLLNGEYDPIITSIAWLPNDRYVLWGNVDGLVSMYDMSAGPSQKQLLKAASFMKFLEYSPNGDKISCLSNHNTARLIEIESGKVLFRENNVNDNTIGKEYQSVDGQYRAVYNKNRQVVEMYDCNNQNSKYAFKIEGEVTSIAFSSDSSLLALAHRSGNVTCWDTDNGECKFILDGYRSIYNTVLFSPNGGFVATTAPKGDVIIWDEKSGKKIYVIPAEKGYVFSLAFSPDGERLAVGTESGMIRIWNMDTKEQVDLLERNQDGGCVRCMAFSPDGEQISASYNDGTVVVWACPSLKTLISDVRQRLCSRKFTDDEKKKYYLEEN